MARQRKEPKAKNIKLRQPDRSAPAEKTLLNLAQERDLFSQADDRMKELRKQRKADNGDADSSDEEEEDDGAGQLSPGADRFLEAMLYTITIAMVHFTFDVLVQHQYGEEINWVTVIKRAGQAWLCRFLLLCVLTFTSINQLLLTLMASLSPSILSSASPRS